MIITDAEWTDPRKVAGVSEFAVFTPIRLGRIPGQRYTYEERLRVAIGVIQDRAREDRPTGLNQVAQLHYGKLAILRPEQFGYTPFPAGAGESRLGAPVDPYRMRLVPEPEAGQPESPVEPDQRNRSFLLTMVTFDGDIKVYFRDIAEFVAGDFDRIYRNCEDYPGTADFEKFWLWIRRYQVGLDLFYSAYPGLSVARIKYLERFKQKFDEFARKVRSPDRDPGVSVDALFGDFMRETQQVADAFPAPSGLYKF